MRLVIQRTVSEAEVRVENKVVGKIAKGLIVYVGVEPEDTEDDVKWLAKKTANLRIFNDDEDRMNLSVLDIEGAILAISQFTLYASTKKGNRPSFIKSAKPEFATVKYEQFMEELRKEYKLEVASGVFGAHMDVDYTNDGPVTIVMDSKRKE